MCPSSRREILVFEVCISSSTGDRKGERDREVVGEPEGVRVCMTSSSAANKPTGESHNENDSVCGRDEYKRCRLGPNDW